MPSRPVCVLCGVLLLVICLPSAAAPSASSTQNTMTDAQLRVLFRAADKNNDGYLDAEELAIAFRGPRAKPMPHFALHDLQGKTYPVTQDLRRYPDEIFRLAADTDFDGRVSWPEYRAYGESYATVLRQEIGFERALQAAYLKALQNQAAAMYRQASYVRQQYASRYRSAQRYFRNVSYRARPRYYAPHRYTPRRVTYHPRPVRHTYYRPPARRPPVRRRR